MNITDIIIEYGYIVVFILMFMEMIFIVGFFVPGGNSFLVLIGYLTTVSNLNYFVLIIIAIISTSIGNTITYYIGKKGGRKLFKKESSLFLTTSRLETIEKTFYKYGKFAVIFGRPIYLIRNFHSALAGISGMSTKKFTTYNILGAVIWVVGFTFIGWLAGIIFKDTLKYSDIKEIINTVIIFGTIFSLVSVIVGIIYNKITEGKPKGINFLRRILK